MIAGNPAADYGIVTRGAAYAVACEAIIDLNLMERVHVLNIRRTFPLHRDSLISFARGKKKLVIMEDQDGFLETMIKREAFGAITCPVQGKEIFPAWGELHYEQIRDFLATEFGCTVDFPLPLAVPPVPDRLGACCEGCPHRPALYAIEQALEEGRGITGGDIGCSSLPPHRTDWLLCMNAGIGISQGIAQLLPDRPLVSTGGDGSLFHGGLLSLQSAVENGINLTHIILDNRSVAMTGHQPSPTGTGTLDLRGLLRSIGVRRIFEVSAFTPSLLILAIAKAKKLDGVKVIRVKGECALQREERQPDYRHRFTLGINPETCHGCTSCYSGLQCPAIVREDATGQLSIDPQRCRRCGACLDVCPNNAILIHRGAALMGAALPGIVRRFRRVAFQLKNP
jgi:indolepyruvate ferredoxin oxidoreductase alpha subunit